jgi:hypothetical protein
MGYLAVSWPPLEWLCPGKKGLKEKTIVIIMNDTPVKNHISLLLFSICPLIFFCFIVVCPYVNNSR